MRIELVRYRSSLFACEFDRGRDRSCRNKVGHIGVIEGLFFACFLGCECDHVVLVVDLAKEGIRKRGKAFVFHIVSAVLVEDII